MRIAIEWQGLIKIMEIPHPISYVRLPKSVELDIEEIGKENLTINMEYIEFKRTYEEYECPCCGCKLPLYKKVE